MRPAALVAASILLLAACSGDATEPADDLVLASSLRSAAVDSGGTVVASFTITNPGLRTVRLSAPSSCAAYAWVIDATGAKTATPTIICSPTITHYRFAPGDTSQWDVGLDLRSPPGAYRVVARFNLGRHIEREDTLPFTIQ